MQEKNDDHASGSDYRGSTITVSTTVEEQAFSLPRLPRRAVVRAVGPALRCKTNGLSAPVLARIYHSGIALR